MGKGERERERNVDRVAGTYLGLHVKSRRMFALCANHEFVKT